MIEAERRAAEAERSVDRLFAGRLLHLPFTHMARVSYPAPRRVDRTWNYWWQAHYLDALVDAAHRHLRQGNPAEAQSRAVRAHRLLRSIRMRNAGRLTNDFYDDMAWLLLAADRLGELGAMLDRWPSRLLRTTQRALTARLRSAVTDDLGGGLYWNTTRDFKNVPATAPAALYFARHEEESLARSLIDWIYDNLQSEQTGLIFDGIRVQGGQQVREERYYTYNQGVVLGVLLTLGDQVSLDRAAQLVEAIDTHLTTPTGRLRVMTTHGGGDGGLFTGILARYLAMAAVDSGLAEPTRALASRLIGDTAQALWAGRSARTIGRGEEVTVFPTDPGKPSEQPGVVELSTQLQAWLVFEAAVV